jgi:hypothetical protein
VGAAESRLPAARRERWLCGLWLSRSQTIPSFRLFSSVQRGIFKRLTRIVRHQARQSLEGRIDLYVGDNFGRQRPSCGRSARLAGIMTAIHGFGLSCTKAPRNNLTLAPSHQEQKYIPRTFQKFEVTARIFVRGCIFYGNPDSKRDRDTVLCLMTLLTVIVPTNKIVKH